MYVMVQVKPAPPESAGLLLLVLLLKQCTVLLLQLSSNTDSCRKTAVEQLQESVLLLS
jgi:hypothetical protein